jgi:hypothetical protein
MAVFLGGAGFLALWSYQRLVPVQRQAREAASLASRLSGEIAVMEGRYSAEEIAELMQSYDRAKGLLFSTPGALKEWFQQVQLQMVPLALDATADFGRAAITNSASHKLAVVPATLSLNIQPASQVEAVRSPYERVLRFLDELGRQEKRMDLVELQVTGGSNSISRAVAMLQLWAGEEAKP